MLNKLSNYKFPLQKMGFTQMFQFGNFTENFKSYFFCGFSEVPYPLAGGKKLSAYQNCLFGFNSRIPDFLKRYP